MNAHPDKTPEPTREQMEAAVRIAQHVAQGRCVYVFPDENDNVQWIPLERAGDVERVSQ